MSINTIAGTLAFIWMGTTALVAADVAEKVRFARNRMINIKSTLDTIEHYQARINDRVEAETNSPNRKPSGGEMF